MSNISMNTYDMLTDKNRILLVNYIIVLLYASILFVPLTMENGMSECFLTKSFITCYKKYPNLFQKFQLVMLCNVVIKVLDLSVFRGEKEGNVSEDRIHFFGTTTKYHILSIKKGGRVVARL